MTLTFFLLLWGTYYTVPVFTTGIHCVRFQYRHTLCRFSLPTFFATCAVPIIKKFRHFSWRFSFFFCWAFFVFWWTTISVDLYWKWALWTSVRAHRKSKAPTKGKDPGCSVFWWAFSTGGRNVLQLSWGIIRLRAQNAFDERNKFLVIRDVPATSFQSSAEIPGSTIYLYRHNMLLS